MGRRSPAKNGSGLDESEPEETRNEQKQWIKEDDELISRAIEEVVSAGMAATSFLQRRLRIGYAQAGRLIDEPEAWGIVGPSKGSKPRQMLINYQQWQILKKQAFPDDPSACEIYTPSQSPYPEASKIPWHKKIFR